MGVRRVPTDEELLAATAVRPDAFAEFYRRHLRAVLALLLHRTQHREIAADLCAEVFAAALEGAGRFDPERGPARAWLFGIAHHKLLESWRRGRVEAASRQRLGMPVRTLTDDDLERVENLADLRGRDGLVRALVDGLPPEQRDAIVARVVDERDYAEIATELECSEAVIRQRVSRGLGRVRRGLLESER
jgi:RNA polymerase sigma factor (sigma-70 family)